MGYLLYRSCTTSNNGRLHISGLYVDDLCGLCGDDLSDLSVDDLSDLSVDGLADLSVDLCNISDSSYLSDLSGDGLFVDDLSVDDLSGRCVGNFSHPS